MSSIQDNLKTLADYVERSTDWREGGATRHDARAVLESLPDDVDWLEKGIVEWRAKALDNARHAEAARATARVAIGHLHAVLNKARTYDEQQRADTAARDWLTSIGSEPT